MKNLCSPPVRCLRCTANIKKAPGTSEAFKELTIQRKSRDQGALDAPILSQRTSQARRGSRKRPDPPQARDGACHNQAKGCPIMAN